MSQISRLLGQLTRFARSILLQPDDPSKRPSLQFILGKPRYPIGIGLSWWYSDDTWPALDGAAALIVSHCVEFRDCDLETVREAISDAIQELASNRNVFDVDKVITAETKTLFEARAIADTPKFAQTLLGEIQCKLRSQICKSCTVYVVPRFKTSSFKIEQDDVMIINKQDHESWRALVEKGYVFDGWSPASPHFSNRRDEGSFTPQVKFECVLVSEKHGTARGSRFGSILAFRALMAVLFATASDYAPYPIHRSAADSPEFCAQFPHTSCQDRNLQRKDCSPIVPYYASDIDVPQDAINRILAWYAACGSCGQEQADRLRKAAHFLNCGMNSRGVEAFLNYFIVLDALFGSRGAVEASIISGVGALKMDSAFTEKTRWLFELRSELVHGGSRHIAEWPRHSRYLKHFRSEPLRDVVVLAQQALLRSPTMFCAQP